MIFLMNNSRVIPKKNYIILSVIIVASVVLLYYFYMWFLAYKDSKINMPILDKYVNVINYNELDNYIVENPDSIIYVSVTDDNKIKNFEEKMVNLFENDELKNEILYMDITDDIKNSKIKKEMKNKYSVNYANITNVPSVLVFEDGNLKSIFDVADSGYSINKLKTFINSVDFKEEDLD